MAMSTCRTPVHRFNRDQDERPIKTITINDVRYDACQSCCDYYRGVKYALSEVEQADPGTGKTITVLDGPLCTHKCHPPGISPFAVAQGTDRMTGREFYLCGSCARLYSDDATPVSSVGPVPAVECAHPMHDPRDKRSPSVGLTQYGGQLYPVCSMCSRTYGITQRTYDDKPQPKKRLEWSAPRPEGKPYVRPKWTEWFLRLAGVVAERSDCDVRVGAVVVDSDHRIVSVGYNAAPAGQPGCWDGDGCPRRTSGTAHGTGDYDTCRSVHAEANALIYAGRGRAQDCVLYVTHSPCGGCLKLAEAAGIAWIITPEGTTNLKERNGHG